MESRNGNHFATVEQSEGSFYDDPLVERCDKHYLDTNVCHSQRCNKRDNYDKYSFTKLFITQT